MLNTGVGELYRIAAGIPEPRPAAWLQEAENIDLARVVDTRGPSVSEANGDTRGSTVRDALQVHFRAKALE
jgi:hypothetical protein